MRTTRLLALGALASLSLVMACSDSGSSPSVFGTAGKGNTAGKANTAGTSSVGGNGNEAGTDPGSGGTGPIITTGGGGTGPDPGGECGVSDDEDRDKDGWSKAQGDLNDCDANVNPGAIDIVNFVKDAEGKDTEVPLPDDQQVDEDGDGKATLPTDKTSCDDGLGVSDTDPFSAAKAIGLCNKVDEASKKWGVISAGYNRIAGGFLGQPLSVSKNVGLLDGFGGSTKPREGANLLALSTGEARASGHAGFSNDTCGQSGTQGDSFPPGFPKQGSCGVTGKPYDGVALDLKIRVPTNAKSMSFNFRFFTCEFPQYVCQQYNDVFAVLMVPNPLPTDHNMYDPGSKSADIAFEGVDAKKGNVIGVNNQSFLTSCKGGVGGYKNCKGEGELAGSGFEGHAGSAWLQSQVPVPPGEVIYLRFAIWDSGDGALDSSVVIDNLKFSAEGGTGVVTKIDEPIE